MPITFDSCSCSCNIFTMSPRSARGVSWTKLKSWAKKPIKCSVLMTPKGTSFFYDTLSKYEGADVLTSLYINDHHYYCTLIIGTYSKKGHTCSLQLFVYRRPKSNNYNLRKRKKYNIFLKNTFFFLQKCKTELGLQFCSTFQDNPWDSRVPLYISDHM